LLFEIACFIPNYTNKAGDIMVVCSNTRNTWPRMFTLTLPGKNQILINECHHSKYQPAIKCHHPKSQKQTKLSLQNLRQLPYKKRNLKSSSYIYFYFTGKQHNSPSP